MVFNTTIMCYSHLSIALESRVVAYSGQCHSWQDLLI